jgi:hypothetical protein
LDSCAKNSASRIGSDLFSIFKPSALRTALEKYRKNLTDLNNVYGNMLKAMTITKG